MNGTIGRRRHWWLAEARKTVLEETTRDRYEDLIRIGPTLGAMKAAKLEAQTLERWYARLRRCRSTCDGKRRTGHDCRPLSSSTVRKIHFIVSAALTRAVRYDQIPVNRAQLAEPHRQRRPSRTHRPQQRPGTTTLTPSASSPAPGCTSSGTVGKTASPTTLPNIAHCRRF